MEKEMIEHLEYLKDKGLYDIEFREDSIKAIRCLDFKENSEGDIKRNSLNLNISLLKDNTKIMYHGTSLTFAKKIINEGLIKSYSNKSDIEFNKIFLTDKVWNARRFALEQVKYDSVIISIDVTKYQVYTFITDQSKIGGQEWFIWDNIDIKDVEFNYFKDGIAVGVLTAEEIIKLPIAEEPRINVFLEVIRKMDIYLFKDPFGMYGARHAVRVIFILRELERYQLLSTQHKTILAYAGLYHDIGRKDKEEDLVHGFESYRIISNAGIIDDSLNDEELEIMKFIIQCHCINDEDGYKALKDYKIQDVETARLLYDMFKDANSLDRIRLGDFNIKYLRCYYSYKVKDFAQKLYTIDTESKIKK